MYVAMCMYTHTYIFPTITKLNMCVCVCCTSPFTTTSNIYVYIYILSCIIFEPKSNIIYESGCMPTGTDHFYICHGFMFK